MPYTVPHTFVCILCGCSFLSRAPHPRYCPDCRRSWNLRQSRDYARAKYQTNAEARRQRNMETSRKALSRLAAKHSDSVLACLVAHGHDEDYEPPHAAEPVVAQPGSRAKVEALAARVLAGQPLWCDGDWAASQE